MSRPRSPAVHRKTLQVSRNHHSDGESRVRRGSSPSAGVSSSPRRANVTRDRQQPSRRVDEHRASAASPIAELAQQRDDMLQEVRVAPAAPATKPRPHPDVLTQDDPVAHGLRPRARRSCSRRPGPTAASGPDPAASGRSRTGRSRASRPRSARARSWSGWSMAVLRWPRMTRSGAAPAAISASRTGAPSCPHGWRWTEIGRPDTVEAAATARRTCASPGATGSDVPISPRIPGRMPEPSTPSSTSARSRSVISASVGGRDPGLVDRLQVLAGAQHDVDAGALGDLAESDRRSRRAIGGVSSTIVRPPARTKGAELLDGRGDVGEPVVVRVGARVPARLGGDRRIPRASVRRWVAVECQQWGRVHPEVLVGERDPSSVESIGPRTVRTTRPSPAAIIGSGPMRTRPGRGERGTPPSVDQEATVDVGDLARDVARVLGGEERDQRGDLVGRSRSGPRGCGSRRSRCCAIIGPCR